MEFLQTFLQNDLVLLFTIMSLGCLLGKSSVGNIELSSSGGVLFVALFFGHFGYTLPDNISVFGFAFFIYAIGFGAGPRFFQTFRRNGFKYGLVAVFVAVIALSTAVLCASVFDFSPLFLPGILAGSLTQTSTLAAAFEITQDPILSVSYGITYPFGLVGMLMLIQFFPRVMGIDLKKEASRMGSDADSDEETGNSINPTNTVRAYTVENEGLTGKSLRELDFRQQTGMIVLSIKQGDSFLHASSESILQMNDHILVEGTLKDHIKFEMLIGSEIIDATLVAPHSSSARVVINKKQVLNHSIKELGLPQFFNVFVSRMLRGGVDLEVNPDLVLERGDILTIVGPEQGTANAITFLGREEHKFFETDMFTFCAGMVLGILLGRIEWPVINTSIGNAGGLLFMGILLGYLRNFGPFSGRVPVAARYILQELGLLLFLAGIGTKAGQGLVDHIFIEGPAIFISGVLVTSVTLISTIVFCRYVLRFDWNTSFGATTGGVTSTVALKIVTQEADSQYPVLGYAGVYAFANILLTLLGHVILLI